MSTAELEQLSGTDLGRPATAEREPPRGVRARLRIVPERAAADGVATLFTAVRPCDGAGTARARRRVPGLDGSASVTSWIVAEGLRQLAPPDRARVLERWRVERYDRAGALVADGGCEIGIDGVPVTGALRLALLRWLPLSRVDLVVIESGLWRNTPANALTLLIRPPTIWPAAEALTAARLFPCGSRFEPERFLALERHARGRVRESHLSLLRVAAERIERQLPAAGLPVASSIVAAGCAVLLADDEWGTAIAARQLARYATSERVTREAREGPSS